MHSTLGRGAVYGVVVGHGAEVRMVAREKPMHTVWSTARQSVQKELGPAEWRGPRHGGGKEAGIDGNPFHHGVGRHLLAECFVIVYPPESILTPHFLDDKPRICQLIPGYQIRGHCRCVGQETVAPGGQGGDLPHEGLRSPDNVQRCGAL